MCGEIKLLRYKILCEDVPVGFSAVKQLAHDHGVDAKTMLNMIRTATGRDNTGVADIINGKTAEQLLDKITSSPHGKEILQKWQSSVTGTGYDFSWKDGSFSQWLTANIAKGFNDDQDFMIRGIRAVLPKETGDAAVNAIRKWFLNNPSTPGNIAAGALGSSALASAHQAGFFDKLMQKIAEWTGLGGEAAKEAQKAAEQGGINAWHIAAGAGIGAGLIWLYNKFKKNPRQQLTPREMIYAMQLNEKTPNYQQNG